MKTLSSVFPEESQNVHFFEDLPSLNKSKILQAKFAQRLSLSFSSKAWQLKYNISGTRITIHFSYAKLIKDTRSKDSFWIDKYVYFPLITSPTSFLLAAKDLGQL